MRNRFLVQHLIFPIFYKIIKNNQHKRRKNEKNNKIFIIFVIVFFTISPYLCLSRVKIREIGFYNTSKIYTCKFPFKKLSCRGARDFNKIIYWSVGFLCGKLFSASPTE